MGKNFMGYNNASELITAIGNKIIGTEGMIADTFDSTTVYSVGDIVTYKHGLYKFTSAHSAGAWTGSDVTAINVVDIIGNIDTVLEAVL